VSFSALLLDCFILELEDCALSISSVFFLDSLLWFELFLVETTEPFLLSWFPLLVFLLLQPANKSVDNIPAVINTFFFITYLSILLFFLLLIKKAYSIGNMLFIDTNFL